MKKKYYRWIWIIICIFMVGTTILFAALPGISGTSSGSTANSPV